MERMSELEGILEIPPHSPVRGSRLVSGKVGTRVQVHRLPVRRSLFLERSQPVHPAAFAQAALPGDVRVPNSSHHLGARFKLCPFRRTFPGAGAEELPVCCAGRVSGSVLCRPVTSRPHPHQPPASR